VMMAAAGVVYFGVVFGSGAYSVAGLKALFKRKR